MCGLTTTDISLHAWLLENSNNNNKIKNVPIRLVSLPATGLVDAKRILRMKRICPMVMAIKRPRPHTMNLMCMTILLFKMKKDMHLKMLNVP